MIYIVDDIGAVVQAMRTGQYDTYHDDNFSKAGSPFYMYGHRQEISNRLSDMDQRPQQKKQKYPLIALNLDIVETVRGDMTDFKLNILIATNTSINLNAQERMTQTFKPILYPLYAQFLNAFANAALFQWDDQLDQLWPPHTKVDRPFWGTAGTEGNLKNIFNDPIDAIELINFQFTRKNPIY